MEDHLKRLAAAPNHANKNLHIDNSFANDSGVNHSLVSHGESPGASAVGVWPPEIYVRVYWDGIKSLFTRGVQDVLHSDTDAFFHSGNIWTVLRDPTLSNVDLVGS